MAVLNLNLVFHKKNLMLAVELLEALKWPQKLSGKALT
jgi:hypothetical protein